MKKKNLNSLDLNKKVISKLEVSEVKGGIILFTVTCTYGEICQAAKDFYDGFVDGYNATRNQN